jgi:membrane protein
VPRPRLTPREARAFALELRNLYAKNRLATYANAVAFRTFVAMIPLSLLGIAVLGVSGEKRIWTRTIAPAIQKRVLPKVFEGINASVEQIFSSDGTLLIVFAAALAFFDVFLAVRTTISALNEITGSADDDTRPRLLRLAVSCALAAVVIVCIVGALLVVIAGGRIADSTGGLAHFGFGVLRWLVGLALLGLAIGLVFRYGPYASRSKTWVSVGSVAIVVAWVVESLGFQWFVTSVANYRSGPGILLAFLVLTTYVYTSSMVFLVGAQLNELLRAKA